MKRTDLKGKRFSRLLVECENGRNVHGEVLWKCICDCGNIKTVTGRNLRTGHTKSCSCLGRENLVKANITHGKTGLVEYRRYQSMLSRCYNEDSTSYPRYGAVGVEVDTKWLGPYGFETFLNDVGYKPEDTDEIKWTLERLSSFKDYEPGNVVWKESKYQARNRARMRSNKSGVPGVHLDEKKPNVFSYVATWMELDGKKRTKSFSLQKYGEDAIVLAKECRERQIQRLQLEGAGYSQWHGLLKEE